MQIIKVRSLSELNVDEYVVDLCSSVGKDHIVMVIYWDNSIMYIGGDKCSEIMKNMLLDLEKEKALAKIILLKPLGNEDKQVSSNTSTYIIDKLIEIDFSLRDSMVNEYYVDRPTRYYLDERVKVIN